MANTLADVDKKLHASALADEMQAASQTGIQKLWLLVPLAVLTIGGGAFLVVRRFRKG
jgi:hypothetical protein